MKLNCSSLTRVLLCSVGITALPATAFAVVEFGARGPAVTSLQTLLTGAKFYSGQIDGKFGSATFDAVMAFQNANGLEADGVAGSGTWKKLVPGSVYETMGEGSKKTAEVIELQKALGIKADGKFGPATQKAVKAFQGRSGIRPTGIVGPDTWHVLSLK